MRVESVVLENRFVRLEPLRDGLREAMRAALDVDHDSWSILTTAGDGDQFDAWWSSAMRDGSARISYAVYRKSDDKLVGTSGIAEIVPAFRRCEVGGTFYRPEARGGVVNPACKRLLLGHAFDAGALRVEILTDAINPRSQAAILKLGAKAEGVLRKHKITWTGRVRDTAMFSITDEDWPIVRDRLDARLVAFD